MTDSLPNYLRSYRQKASLKQDEVGFLLGGTHGSTITRHEEYHRIPSLDLALGYAALYDTDPRILFAGLYEIQLRQIRSRATRLLQESAGEPGQSSRRYESSRRRAFLRSLGSDSYLVPCDPDEY